MHIHEAGLYEVWWKEFTADPSYCLKRNEQQKKAGDDDKKPLTLKGLSGAFLVLLIGYAIAILVFLRQTRYQPKASKVTIHRVNKKANLPPQPPPPGHSKEWKMTKMH